MRAQRRLARKVKPAPRRSRQRSAKPLLAHPLNASSRTRRIRSQNLLPRYTQRVRKHRAQALVPRNHIPQRCLQRRNVKLAHKPHRQRDRIGRARPALQPVQEPQPPLRIRQRDLRRTHARTQRRPRRLRSSKTLRQSRNRRRLEQAADRNLNIQGRADAADQPRRQQRMTPSAKKLSSIPTRSSPSTSANSAHRISSCGVRGPRRTATAVTSGAGSATTVELAVGRQRQPIQHHIGRRHHVVRKAAPQHATATPRHPARPRRRPPHTPPAACCQARPRAQSPQPATHPRCRTSAASISPGSIRNPRSFT